MDDGAVVIRRGRVVKVGRWRDLARSSGRVVDLGECVLLPGLVNSHCHLDYTAMAGQFPPPRVFSDWLKTITTAKSEWHRADYLDSWRQGAAMLVRTGTTTVGDIEAVPEILPEAWASTPLRVLSFLEMIGITGRRTPEEILAEAAGLARSLRHPRNRVGLSPHAPYSTLPDLLRQTARLARRHRWPVAIHVAESSLEFDMFARGNGPMFDWIQKSGRDMSDCGQGTPVGHICAAGLTGRRVLAIHGNYLGPGDAALLARQRIHLAHCPRSHAYFGHAPFPLRRLLRAGVNVSLATDSLASVRQRRREPLELSLFEELRAAARSQPWLSPARLLRLATVDGAAALGLGGLAGEISPGAFADLIALPDQGPRASVCERIIQHHGTVAASLIGGAWAIPPQGS